MTLGSPPFKNHSPSPGRGKSRRLFPLLIVLAVLVLLLVLLSVLLGVFLRERASVSPSSSGFSFSLSDKENGGSQAVPIPSGGLTVWKNELYSTNAILVDNTSSLVIGVKDAYEKIYPASLTKVMTAVLALEYFTDLSEEIVISPEMFAYITAQNASVAGFSPGESVKVRDLLYGLLLPSGADAAIALATRVAGSEKDFAVLMNQKAAAIGMENTRFVTCTGLHDDGHYSTCYDLMLLFRYALGNAAFRRIVSTDSYTTSPTPAHPKGIYLSHTLFKALKSSGRNNNYIAGGKTGYTLEAHQCLVSFAEIESRELILVTVGAGQTDRNRQEHILDALYVYATCAR